MKNITKTLDNLKKYWDNRSDSYSISNIEELNNFKGEAWLKILIENAPKKDKLKVLDIGTGPGLFAILMASAGHDVTAVDVSKGMLEHAKENSEKFNLNINFLNINGFDLPLDNNSFDLIISRNVVWNIEEPIEAFKEWKRVLKNDGKIVYFDANWYLYLFDENQKKEVEYDRNQVEILYNERFELTEKTKFLEDVARNLKLSKENRPNWDKIALNKCGLEVIKVGENIGRYVWDEKQKIQYRATPLFMIVAKK